MNKSRNKLMSLLFLAGMQTLLILAYIVLADQISMSVLALFMVTLLICVAAVLYIYTAVKKSHMRVILLPTEYQDSYMAVNEIIATSTMANKEKEEVMAMILEIFEEASLNGRPVIDVTNNDLKTFTEGFIQEGGGEMTLTYLLTSCGILYIIYLLFMKLYMVVRHDGFTLKSIEINTLDAGIVVLYGIIAFVFFPWMLIWVKKAAKDQWQGAKQGLLILPFLLPVGLVASMILIDNKVFINFLDSPMPLLNSVYKLAASVILLIGLYILKSNLRKNQGENL